MPASEIKKFPASLKTVKWRGTTPEKNFSTIVKTALKIRDAKSRRPSAITIAKDASRCHRKPRHVDACGGASQIVFSAARNSTKTPDAPKSKESRATTA